MSHASQRGDIGRVDINVYAVTEFGSELKRLGPSRDIMEADSGWFRVLGVKEELPYTAASRNQRELQWSSDFGLVNDRNG